MQMIIQNNVLQTKQQWRNRSLDNSVHAMVWQKDSFKYFIGTVYDE